MNVEVCIVGGGPTGLMLGCLAQASGFKSLILERNATRDRRPKAVMIHARQLELLDRIGILDRFLKKAIVQNAIKFQRHDGVEWEISFSALDTIFPYYINIAQPDIEDILETAYRDLGGSCLHGVAYTQHRDEGGCVTVACEGGGLGELRCDFLLGCDGGSSAVRKNLGVEFDGQTMAVPYLLGEGLPDKSLDPNAVSSMLITSHGVVSWLPFFDGRIRVAGPGDGSAVDDNARLSEEGFLALQEKLVPKSWPRVLSPERHTFYRVHSRLARRWGCGRVWLAGDAAHLNPPAGGQALNLGFGDAEAIVAALSLQQNDEGVGRALARYEAERRRVAEATLAFVDMMPLVTRMRCADTDYRIAQIHAELGMYAFRLSHLYLDYAAEGDELLCSSDQVVRSTIALGRRVPLWALPTGEAGNCNHRKIRFKGTTCFSFDDGREAVVQLDGIVRDIRSINPS